MSCTRQRRASSPRGGGFLAADESDDTIKKRFAPIGLESTEEHRRAYRRGTRAAAPPHVAGLPRRGASFVRRHPPSPRTRFATIKAGEEFGRTYRPSAGSNYPRRLRRLPRMPRPQGALTTPPGVPGGVAAPNLRLCMTAMRRLLAGPSFAAQCVPIRIAAVSRQHKRG
jgi:hypothetical protein